MASYQPLPGEVPMFDDIPQPGPAGSASKPAQSRQGCSSRPKWSRLGHRNAKCDLCVQAQVDDPSAPAGWPAVWKRVYPTDELWLCAGHATDLQAAEKRGVQP
jgi:hypothetical protein